MTKATTAEAMTLPFHMRRHTGRCARSTQRFFMMAALLVAIIMVSTGAATDASPHSGCGVRTYADSCIDACCVWCPASIDNATTTITTTAAVSDLSGETRQVTTAPRGSCHDRDQAPCGAAGVSRPAIECYVELGVALAILAGVLGSGAGLCYARRWWVRRRAARLNAVAAQSRLKSRSGERALTMVDIPYAELEGGRLAYYASPYALAGDVERVPAQDQDADKTDRARTGVCQTQ
ncbi:hypothetical protein pkur_cds_600 [Pandoravirus kuranda]|uniref:Uncharacterized protein n=1 Tax=Pandoravirus kuranda TaxID=3019033 RepID=A0AA95J2C6_9VIRU|nr:hypothetical protein pkur_cds_600 [Pandoravirus kuranda]